jgi:hypothetical protein
MRIFPLPALLVFLLGIVPVLADDAPPAAIAVPLPVAGITALTFSQSSRQLYLSTPEAMLVLDGKGQELNRLPARDAAGVVLVPALRRGFIVSGAAPELTVFDSGHIVAVAHLPVPLDHLDQAVFEPRTTELFVAGQREAKNRLAALDAGSLRDIGTLDLPAKPTSLLADGAGHLFLTLPASDAILVVDARRREIASHWQVGAACHQPGPAALDEIHHRLYVACGNGQLVAMDSDYGAVETSLPASPGLNALVYDPSEDRLYAADADGSVLVAGTGGNGKFAVLTVLPGATPTRFLALDGASHTLYRVGQSEAGAALIITPTDPSP